MYRVEAKRNKLYKELSRYNFLPQLYKSLHANSRLVSILWQWCAGPLKSTERKDFTRGTERKPPRSGMFRSLWTAPCSWTAAEEMVVCVCSLFQVQNESTWLPECESVNPLLFHFSANSPQFIVLDFKRWGLVMFHRLTLHSRAQVPGPLVHGTTPNSTHGLLF